MGHFCQLLAKGRLRECLRCLANVWLGADFAGHACYRAPTHVREFVAMGRFKRKGKDVAERKVVADLKACPVLGALAAVRDYLTVEKYDDGSPRRTSTLLLFYEDGLLKVCLSDRENDRVCFLSGETLDTLLQTLDAALETGSVEWRPSRGGRGGKR